jgi:hypothetical protein
VCVCVRERAHLQHPSMNSLINVLDLLLGGGELHCVERPRAHGLV